MLEPVLQWLVAVGGLVVVAGTLLGLLGNPHWFVRMWDFPRVQIAVLGGTSALLYGLFFFEGAPLEWFLIGATLLATGWQLYKILPYTRLFPTAVERSERPARERENSSVRLLISNVLMENRKFGRLIDTVREQDPDLFLAVEVDVGWMQALEPLAESYPHVVRQPQHNYYGMVLFSRFPLVGPEIRFLVQDDIPSIHTAVQLPSGDHVFLHALHPRPPEPIRDQDSTPRDAELVMVGRAIGDEADRPSIVAGDLNDVAWSPTSELFLRLSGLLDPRVGRGFFNSYNANNPLFRYPLDHVFHSNDFRLVELRRLPNVGSDHFPMLVELSFEPEAEAEQPEPRKEAGDDEEAQEKLEEQVSAARTGDDRPGRE